MAQSPQVVWVQQQLGRGIGLSLKTQGKKVADHLEASLQVLDQGGVRELIPLDEPVNEGAVQLRDQIMEWWRCESGPPHACPGEAFCRS